MHISPIQNGERVVYVEFTLLGSHMSDPPNVPSLQEAGEKLQTLVDTGELIVCSYTTIFCTMTPACKGLTLLLCTAIIAQ